MLKVFELGRGKSGRAYPQAHYTNGEIPGRVRAQMSGDTLTIVLFFVSTGIGAGFTAMTVTSWKSYILWVLAAILTAVGLFWVKLLEKTPMLAARLAEVAQNPNWWFIIALAFVVLLVSGKAPRIARPKERNTSILSSEETDRNNEQVWASIEEQNERIDVVEGLINKHHEEVESLGKLREAIALLSTDSAEIKKALGAEVLERTRAATAMVGLSDRLDGTRDGIQANLSSLRTRYDQFEQAVLAAFRARSAIQTAKLVASNIERLASRMISAERNVYDSEDRWNKDYEKWETAIGEYCMLAKAWLSEPRNPMDIKPKEYDKVDVQHIGLMNNIFNNGKMVRRYETLVLATEKFEVLERELISSLTMKAEI